MSLDPIRGASLATARRIGGARARDGGLFRVDVAPGENAASPEAALVGAASLLFVQEHGGPPGLDARISDDAANEQAAELLAALASLQRDLLRASASTASLTRLEQVVRAVGVPADPELAALLRGARLRAHVELARHGWE